MDALDQLRDSANGRGIVDRLRSSRGLAVAVAAGILLLIAWVAWAVYVTSDNGGAAGLGVVIAWPALLVALALISLPFVGAYLLVRRLRSSDDTDAAPDTGGPSGSEPEEEPADEAEGDEEDDGEEKDEGDGDEEEGKDDGEGEEDDHGEEAGGEEESPEPEESDGDDEDEGDEEEASGD